MFIDHRYEVLERLGSGHWLMCIKFVIFVLTNFLR